MHPTLHSPDAEIIGAATLALVMLAITTAFHYESLRFLGCASRGRPVSQHWAVGVLAALVGAHLAEVALYAGAYDLGANVLGLGGLRGSTDRAALDFFYFAAETYSTLGYGDLVPMGALRLVASVEALNGLLLLAWSGAFLFGVLRAGVNTATHRETQPRRASLARSSRRRTH